VHDIGKNLVDIILSNNGYKVVNLGIKQPLETILAAAEQHNPDAIGMSGLLVKSTVVMKENLEEMNRRGLQIPVVCGGAALNRAYVEDDLRNAYGGPVLYGADAFTGLRIMDELTKPGERVENADEAPVRPRRGETRLEREARQRGRAVEYVPSATAVLDEVPVPPFWGRRVVDDVPLDQLFAFINKKALFANQWQYRRGNRSTREYREFIERDVEVIFEEWCSRVAAEKFVQPRLVYGYFPCQSARNDILVYAPDQSGSEVARITFPREIQGARRCIADYFLPVTSGRKDVIAFQVVTVGHAASAHAQELFRSDRYSDYLHFHGLSVELAEALAEYWHRQVRRELGIATEDGPDIASLFRQKYRGERYSFGYAACPNLEDQRHIFELLRPEDIDVSITSEWQLVPEQSTSAIVVHHPAACYFSI